MEHKFKIKISSTALKIKYYKVTNVEHHYSNNNSKVYDYQSITTVNRIRYRYEILLLDYNF